MANDAWLIAGFGTPAEIAGHFGGSVFLNVIQNGIGNGGGTTTETEAQTEVKAGTIDKMRFNSVTSQATAGPTFRSRKNGANGNLVAVQTTGVAGEYEDTTHSDSVVASDLYCISSADPTNFVNSTQCGGLGFHYSATGGMTISCGWFRSGGNLNGGTGNFFVSYMGGGNNAAQAMSATETDFRHKVRAPGTFSLMRSSVPTDNKTVSGLSFFFRKNATNANQTTVYAASATGIVVDSTHTDAVVTGDFVVGINTSTDAGNATITHHQGIFVGTGQQWDAVGSGISVIATTAQFYAMVGDQDKNPTESQVQHRLRFASSGANGRGDVRANPLSDSVTFTFRLNGANASQTWSCAGTTGYFEDVTHKDALASGDLICWAQGTSANAQIRADLEMTMGVTANGAAILQTFGPVKHTITGFSQNQGGIAQTFGTVKHAFTGTVLATFRGPILQQFAGITTFIAATEIGVRGTGIRRFWTF